MFEERAVGGDSLLLVLPLSVHRKDGRIYIEDQAANGLVQWLRHFSRMTLAVNLAPGDIPANSVPVDSLGLSDRLEIVLLPRAWHPLTFLRTVGPVRSLIGKLIDSHKYLQFAIGGAWSDWAAHGALIARKKGRKASVWTDRVESEVLRVDAMRATGLSHYYRRFTASAAKFLERRVIRGTTLGLFHGKDTYDSYAPLNANPHLVHDIHLKPEDRITSDALAAKIAAVERGDALDIIYVGRVHPDKGVMDWIDALHFASAAGAPFRARWFGTGPLLDEARATVSRLSLQSQVSFPGMVTDRQALITELRGAHIMQFCHLTPESPRCLIEALVSGTPIVGYASAYPQDLISDHGGGVLTTMDPSNLAVEVVELARNRHALRDLIVKAAKDGEHMNDEAVFAHRADLMKRYS